MIAALFDRLRQGDRNALARLISLAARGEFLGEMRAAVGRHSSLASSTPARSASEEDVKKPSLALRAGVRSSDESKPALVVAFTGSGGVGKSSLLGKLISIVRGQGRKVAVLACDPQSPLSGGALLGDRFRMGSPLDDGVYIRSLAALGGRGAVAEHLDVIIQLLEAFGFDAIFLETVGSGQGDVAVRNLADVVVLLLQPESGDDVQWEKAGILECADVVVVHKSDLLSADQTAAQVRAALDLPHGREVAVLLVSTKKNEGHVELWRTIKSLPRRRLQPSAARALWQETLAVLERRFRTAEDSGEPALGELVERWRRGDEATPAAVREVLRLLSNAD